MLLNFVFRLLLNFLEEVLHAGLLLNPALRRDLIVSELIALHLEPKLHLTLPLVLDVF